MLYTFLYRAASLPNIVEDIYPVDADCLNSAVADFKHFIRANHSSESLVISYFYLAETSDSMILGEFTESFYSKHFRSFLA